MKQLTILVVDDNQSMRSYIIGFLRCFFSSSKVAIEEANDGSQALILATEKIQKHSQSYDLIIMDYEMPTLNGQDTTLKIRELEKTLASEQMSKIITWSSAWNTPYRGADIALPKRCSIHEFTATMAALGYSN